MSVILLPAHIRAARAALQWNQERLAKESDVGLSTISNWERGQRPRGPLRAAVIVAMEGAGIVFLERGIEWNEVK